MDESGETATPSETGAPDRPIRISDEAEYEDLVASHDLVLLELVTPGCGICSSMEPVLGTVAKTAPGVVAIVDGSSSPALARRFDVRRVPTLVVLDRGEEVDRLDDGFQPVQRIVSVLESHAAG